jgi:regulatory protein
VKEIYKVVKLQPLRPQEYEILLQFPDGQLSTLPVHEELVLRFRLVEGKEFAEEEVQELYENLSYGQAYQYGMRLLSRQAYTMEELSRKLQAKEFEQGIIDAVLRKLLDLGLIDDARFATSYIQHHSLLGKKGPNLLKQELKKKGVSEQIINEKMIVCFF